MRRIPVPGGLLFVICACVGEAESRPGLPEPACDPTVDTSCIDEAHGLFVRAHADAAAVGSRDRPFGTLQAALAARVGEPFVFVCAGDYDENVQLSAVDVTILGGLDCDSFVPGREMTRIAPRTGYPLEVSGAASVRIVDLELAAGETAQSSVAAWFHDGARVSLQHVRVSSARGADGESASVNACCRTPHDCTGPSGAPGGASVGVQFRDAIVTAYDVRITTERGGHGGNGGAGTGVGRGGEGGASGVQAGVLWLGGGGALTWNDEAIETERASLDGITLRMRIPTPGFGGDGGERGGTPGRVGAIQAPRAVHKMR